MLLMFPWLSPEDGSIWSFPIIELVFLTLFVTATIHVPRDAICLRLINAVILFLLTYMLQQAFFHLCENRHWRAAAAPLVWIQFLSASELILVTKVDSCYMLARGGGTPVLRSMAETKPMIALLWNLRRIGTQWEVKSKELDAKGVGSPKGRLLFVLERLMTTLLAYLVLDIMISAPAPDQALLTFQKQTLVHISSLSLEDVIFRVIGTASFWLSTYLINLVMANSVAILCVGTGVNSSRNWPPLYGPLDKAYSIRRFWGVSWHQCLRRGLTGHAELITGRMPLIPETRILSRYTRLFVVFLISGLIHHASDLAMGISRAEAGSLLFFLLQPLGIMIEDGVQKLTGTLPSSSPFGRVRVRRISGYAWVMAFLVWTTPTWFYPQQRTGVDPEGLLPVHLVKPLLAYLGGCPSKT